MAKPSNRGPSRADGSGGSAGWEAWVEAEAGRPRASHAHTARTDLVVRNTVSPTPTKQPREATCGKLPSDTLTRDGETGLRPSVSVLKVLRGLSVPVRGTDFPRRPQNDARCAAQEPHGKMREVGQLEQIHYSGMKCQLCVTRRWLCLGPSPRALSPWEGVGQMAAAASIC